MPRGPRTSAYEQLYQTVLLLASEETTLRERLALAYARYLAPMDLSAIPIGMRPKLEKLLTELKNIAKNGPIEKMDHDAAITLALRIIVIYDGSIP